MTALVSDSPDGRLTAWLRRGASVRRGRPWNWSYKTSSGLYALDAPSSPVERDESRMSLSCVLATRTRDREGDVYEVAGIDTTAHRRLPVAMVDHGMYYPLPIGECETPEGIYAVTISPEEGVARETTFFRQNDEVAYQLYDMGARGLLGNSIGYRPIRSEPLRPDPDRGWPRRRDGTGGLHLIETELTEVSWTCVPANPECVREELSRDRIDGKRLNWCVKAMLRPWAPPRKAFLYVGGGKKMADSGTRRNERSERPGGSSSRSREAEDTDLDNEHADEPYSSQMNRAFVSDAKAMHEHFSGALKANENKCCHKSMCKALNGIRSSMETVIGAHKKSHPSLKIKDELPAEMDHKTLYNDGAGMEDEEEEEGDDEEKPDKGKSEEDEDDMDEETAGKCLLLLEESKKKEMDAARKEVRSAVGK